jgi:dihydrofolate reductase
MKATVYIATSLDGFIAREDGGIDWLPPIEAGDDGEDYGYHAFFASVDTLVMGRNTFELVRGFGQWPYGDKRVIVLTSRPLDLPDAFAGRVEPMSGSPGEVAERLGARGAQHLYVDGGKTIQGFLAEGLIQRLIIARIPVLIGRGIPLFGPVPHDIRLRHVATRAYANGLVQSEYEVVPAAA